MEDIACISSLTRAPTASISCSRVRAATSTPGEAPAAPTKNIIEDLTRSVQISQEMVRSSYQIYLIRTQVKNLTCSYQISLV